MCGGRHAAAGSGKQHELVVRILGLETGDVRGDVVNLQVRFRVMDTGKAILSTQDRKILAGVAGRRSSLLIAAMPTLSGTLQALASRSRRNGVLRI